MRDKNDYFTPSCGVFRDHCASVTQRYDLEAGVLQKGAVQNLDFGYVENFPEEPEKLFTVTTDKGVRYARTVVMAVGAANAPKVPVIPSMPNANGQYPQACHSLQIKEFPDTYLKSRIKAKQATNVVVVGGGLTSAQLTDLAIRRGVARVWHIMRGPCRVKLFDLSLEWMGKYKNTEQARFWLADSDEERLDIIKTARGGGSITPLYNKILKKYIAAGKVELITNTSIVDARFEPRAGQDGGQWHITTNPPVELPPMDFMYFATGIQTDFTSLPYMQTILRKHPVQGFGGFPCLNDDLMWSDDVPLFMVGRLAALRLGPGAANIGGAMVGAERVSWAIEDILRRSQPKAESDSPAMEEYLKGHSNMYSTLACE